MDNLSENDWSQLIEMRKAYLTEKAETHWQNLRSLELYDHFFGQRIFDKWLSAFDLFERREGFQLLEDWALKLDGQVQVWDWGCGTGRASRALLERFKNFRTIKEIQMILTDKESFVTDWAFNKITNQFSNFSFSKIETSKIKFENLILIVSHVINELSPNELMRLSEIATKAKWIFWVESGTKNNSRSLSLVRNKIRHTHKILAPCMSQNICEAVDGKPHTHWCHFFANKQSNYFLNPTWNEFSKKLGIDLRSLPYAFFSAFNHGDVASQGIQGPADVGIQIGRARVYKGYAHTLVCDSSSKLNEWTYQKKDNKDFFKNLKKSPDLVVIPRPPKLNS